MVNYDIMKKRFHKKPVKIYPVTYYKKTSKLKKGLIVFWIKIKFLLGFKIKNIK